VIIQYQQYFKIKKYLLYSKYGIFFIKILSVLYNLLVPFQSDTPTSDGKREENMTREELLLLVV
jgi:hypothetical protein